MSAVSNTYAGHRGAHQPTLHLVLPKHLAQFAMHYMAADQVATRSALGHILLPLLSRKAPPFPKPIAVPEQSACITLKIGKLQSRKYGTKMSGRNRQQLTKALRQLFLHTLLTHTTAHQGTTADAIRSFLEHHGISEELIDPRTLRRHINRKAD